MMPLSIAQHQMVDFRLYLVKCMKACTWFFSIFSIKLWQKNIFGNSKITVLRRIRSVVRPAEVFWSPFSACCILPDSSRFARVYSTELTKWRRKSTIWCWAIDRGDGLCYATSRAEHLRAKKRKSPSMRKSWARQKAHLKKAFCFFRFALKSTMFVHRTLKKIRICENMLTNRCLLSIIKLQKRESDNTQQLFPFSVISKRRNAWKLSRNIRN